MNPKRILPASTGFQHCQYLQEHPHYDAWEDLSRARKKIKKDHSSHKIGNMDEDLALLSSGSQNEEQIEQNNLFQQQFYILRASSFKTISKTGQEKINSFNKNQAPQYDVNFLSSNGKKKHSFVPMSEQKLRKNERKGNGLVNNSQKFIGFGSMNEISKCQRKNSDNDNLNQRSEFFRKRESSFSAIPSGSLHTINTQMINDMMEFDINDANEIDENYLKKMTEMALIKNVQFNANLAIRFLQRKDDEQQFSNIKLFKLLDVDGFSINGFYSETQKMRINLDLSITNKQFEKKLDLQLQSNSNIGKSLDQFMQECSVQFKGSFYDRATQKWEQIKFYISEVKEVKEVQRSYFLNGQLGQINLDDLEMVNEEGQRTPQFGTFVHEQSFRFIAYEGQ